MYLTYSDVETYLNITLSADGQAAVNALIPAVQAFAEDYCNRKWNRGTGDVTETFDATTSDLFFPANTPIDSVTSITVNGQAVESNFIYNYGSYIRLAYLHSWDYLGARPFRSIAITYKSNNPLPADLKQALLQWVADMFKSSEDAGKVTTRVDFGTVRLNYLAQDGLPKFVELVLDRYRHIPLSARL